MKSGKTVLGCAPLNEANFLSPFNFRIITYLQWVCRPYSPPLHFPLLSRSAFPLTTLTFLTRLRVVKINVTCSTQTQMFFLRFTVRFEFCCPSLSNVELGCSVADHKFTPNMFQIHYLFQMHYQSQNSKIHYCASLLFSFVTCLFLSHSPEIIDRKLIHLPPIKICLLTLHYVQTFFVPISVCACDRANA